MRPIRALLLAALPAAALAAGAAPLSAQVPERFENLKVLPRDISRDSLTQIMRNFSFSLGVRCQYCHVQRAPGPDGRDRKSVV
jgi:hypothetical protein